ncbi:hypothetical protein PAEPH01_1127 [Pancytospora epiphaga]|nr:hypothetical protein PAEPH01_1127 [Pancytospora epiphaga]
MSLIEVGITSQDRLVTVETEKMHKYDVLANKLGQEYGCRTRIIPYVMTWDGVVTKYYRRHSKDIGITESYIRTIVLKKTLESISFEYRRGAERLDETENKPVQSRAKRKSLWT